MSAAPDDITCKELVELVTDFLEGRLPAADLARFEGHLEICDACRLYVEQIQRTIELAGSVSDEALEPRSRDALLETFRDWKREAKL